MLIRSQVSNCYNQVSLLIWYWVSAESDHFVSDDVRRLKLNPIMMDVADCNNWDTWDDPITTIEN